MTRPRAKPKLPTDPLSPTKERLAQGVVEKLPQAIADEEGRPARPYRAASALDLLLRRHRITAAMHQAGEDFHALFVAAALDPLRAADLLRLPDGVRDVPMSLRQVEARKSVWLALETLGGMSVPSGSCVWHVVGCDWTLKRWAQSQGWNGRALSQEASSGILIGSLGVLQAHFGL